MPELLSCPSACACSWQASCQYHTCWWLTHTPPRCAPCRSGSVSLTTPVVVTGWVLDPRRSRPPTPVEGSGGQLSFGLQGPDQGDKVPPKLAAVLQAAYDQGSEDIVQVRTNAGWQLLAGCQLSPCCTAMVS